MIGIIQFRTDASLEHEQACFSGILGDLEIEFLSVFNNPEQFAQPQTLLGKYDKLILGGSGQLLMSGNSAMTSRAIDTVAPLVKLILDKDYPVLGICFGNQLLNRFLGGTIGHDETQAEAGISEIKFTDEGWQDPIFALMHNPINVAQGHEDSVIKAPEHVARLAFSAKCHNEAFRFKNNVYGVQFHPEMNEETLAQRLNLYEQYSQYLPKNYLDPQTHPVHGPQVLLNFLAL